MGKVIESPMVQSSRFVVLSEATEEELLERIDILKKKIQELPNPVGSGGRAHMRAVLVKQKTSKTMDLRERPGNQGA